MTGTSGLLVSVYAYCIEGRGFEEDQKITGDVRQEIKKKCESGNANDDLRAH